MIQGSGSFKIVEEISSSDFVFDARGDSLEDLFCACAVACFSAMTDPDLVDQTSSYEFEITADNVDDLLYNFIAELVFLKDSERTFLSHFEIRIAADRTSMKAVVAGERIDYNKHVIKTDVKAATYHGLHVRKKNSGFAVRMILDL